MQKQIQQKKQLQQNNQKLQNQKHQNKVTGSKGEQLATEYLLANGYTILSQNEYMHWGELDIVAQKENIIIFVEVKTRIGFMKGSPYDAVHFAKLKHLLRSAHYFIQKNKLYEYQHRIDVISIILSTTLSVLELKHFENITQ